MRMIAHSPYRRFFIFLLICFFICTGLASQAQDAIKVQGKITGKNGESLPHVTISVVNKKQAQVSDTAGRFSITVPAGSTLQFSYVGYYVRSVKVTTETTLA